MGQTWGGNSCRLRTKPCGLGSPKRTKSLRGKSPTKRRLWGIVPISSIVRFGARMGLTWPCPTSHDTHTVLLPTPKCKARLYHVVVVHSCLLQGLIRHEWDASLANVGQNPKASQKWVEPEEETHIALEQNLAGLAPQRWQKACGGKSPTMLNRIEVTI